LSLSVLFLCFLPMQNLSLPPSSLFLFSLLERRPWLPLAGSLCSLASRRLRFFFGAIFCTPDLPSPCQPFSTRSPDCSSNFISLLLDLFPLRLAQSAFGFVSIRSNDADAPSDISSSKGFPPCGVEVIAPSLPILSRIVVQKSFELFRLTFFAPVQVQLCCPLRFFFPGRRLFILSAFI